MALSRQDLHTKSTNFFADNTTRQITEAKVREFLADLIDSFFNVQDDDVLTETDQAAGSFIPSGGATGQVLGKTSSEDYEYDWVDQTGGDNFPADPEEGQILSVDENLEPVWVFPPNGSNGISFENNNFELGGSLTKNTQIQGNDFNLIFGLTDNGLSGFIIRTESDIDLVVGAYNDLVREVNLLGGVYVRLGDNYYTLLGNATGTQGSFALQSSLGSYVLASTYNAFVSAQGTKDTAQDNDISARLLTATFNNFFGTQVGDYATFQSLAAEVLSLKNSALATTQTNVVPSTLTFIQNTVYGTPDAPLTNLSAIPAPDLTSAVPLCGKVFWVKQAAEPAISLDDYKVDDRYEFAPNQLNKLVILYEYGTKPSFQGVAFIDDSYVVTDMSMTNVHNLGKTYRLATDVLTAVFTSDGPGNIQWMKASTSNGSDATNIAGATASTYTLVGNEGHIGFKVDGVQIATFLEVKALGQLVEYTEALLHKSSTGFGTPTGAGNPYITLINSDSAKFSGTILRAIAQGASATFLIGDETNPARRLTATKNYLITYDYECQSVTSGNKEELRQYFNFTDPFANASYKGQNIVNNYVTIQAAAAVASVKEPVYLLVENVASNNEFAWQMPFGAVGDTLRIQNLKVYEVL